MVRLTPPSDRGTAKDSLVYQLHIGHYALASKGTRHSGPNRREVAFAALL
jgi:hypothetical protein